MVFSNPIELSTLDGNNGFIINGFVDELNTSNHLVSGAGDINGDGIDDLIIGTNFADPDGRDNAGESYVVFGSAEGFNANFELSALDGNNGFVIKGVNPGDFSGSSVSSAGDVNGDGIDDLIISAPFADPDGRNYAGESYVVFGNTNGFEASFELSGLNGNNGFVIEGINPGNFSGITVSSAGDVNDDGIDDLIIGASNSTPNNSNNAGESYVVFGNAAGFDASFDLSGLDGNNGFTIVEVNSDDLSNSPVSIVSSAGDVNGDGIDDLIIGVNGIDPDGFPVAGESYVVFGNANGFDNQLNLSELDGNNGFAIQGINNYDSSGISVSGAGDINGDGLDDLIIGGSSSSLDSNEGRSFVIFGNANGFAANLEFDSLDGTNGFIITGEDSFRDTDIFVSGTGDINGDGIDDLIIGAGGSDPNGVNNAGQSFVVFGSTDGFAANFELRDLDGTNGFAINGINADDFSGFPVSRAGDLNDDGIDDLLIGSGLAGQSYVIFGARTTPENPEPLEIIGNVPGEVTGIAIAENSAVVVDVDSTLEGTGNVTYSILSATDGSFAQDLGLFTIDPNTGVLSFTNAPDFENALDSDNNNIYQVDVVATFGNESVVQFIDVTVTNDVADNPADGLAIIGNVPGQVNNIAIEENTSVVVDIDSTLEGTGNVTYSILSAANGSFAEDLALFTIDPNTGALSFTNTPDFENPLDSDNNNIYQVDVVATSGNESVVQFIDVTVTNDDSDELEIIGNTPGEVTNIAINENSSVVVDVEVNVTGNLTYRILGEQDQSFAQDSNLFTIDPNTGLLSFTNTPDFENPLDQDGDNVYQVDIEVSSGGNTAIQFIDVTVLDVAAEEGAGVSRVSSSQLEEDVAAANNFLVTDQNNNGMIEDRSELFGGEVSDGFADLASFDSNNDGVVNALDENFADVMVWQDANDNGITDFGELISLEEVGITSVPIDFRDIFGTEAPQNDVLAEAVSETALSELI